jgi:succinyl-CoA synthetase beta subunit
VFVVEPVDYKREFYLAILLDRQSQGPVVVGSHRGGMDIEAVAKEDPSAIAKMPVPPGGLAQVDLDVFVEELRVEPGCREQTKDIIKHLLKLFQEKDATLVEINPLVQTKEDKMLCIDAKLSFDDNAAFRQKDIFALRDVSQEDPREVRAARYDLNYIGLDGTIGCLVNGAGLAMATMDIIKLHGGTPANFLDVGGSATKEQVAAAIGILASDPRVRTILVNIFGGIMKCDIVASGIIEGIRVHHVNVPVVVRLQGTNEREAKELMRTSGLPVFSQDDLDAAARKAVAVAN